MRLIFKVIAKSEDDKCLQKGENTHHHKSMFSNENYRFINKNFEQSFFFLLRDELEYRISAWSI